MTYQDKWGHGRVIEKGYRECASRYAIVRDFCLRKFEKRAFTVRDIGANLCYFGLRLTEDFPKCKVTAYEGHHAASKAALAHLESDISAPISIHQIAGALGFLFQAAILFFVLIKAWKNRWYH